jgi:beta-lactamase superfamily II metal-dependent hydrolase
MSIIKSFSVGNGDMFYIQHNSDNFTIIDCCLDDDNKDKITAEINREKSNKTIRRFISTHPDEDHFRGIKDLDNSIDIINFYAVKNKASKETETDSFKHYCYLRDSEKAFYIYKDCKRKWMNESSNERGCSGLSVLWPETNNEYFKDALAVCESGGSPNNISAVIRYKLKDGASVLWLGDLETEFMENIRNDINLEKTTVVFAAHHGRDSGKIPDSWLERLDPQIIIIGEAPSRHLNYYTGYETITQNSAGDIVLECEDDKVHIYATNKNYELTFRTVNCNKMDRADEKYMGSIVVETEYTL